MGQFRVDPESQRRLIWKNQRFFNGGARHFRCLEDLSFRIFRNLENISSVMMLIQGKGQHDSFRILHEFLNKLQLHHGKVVELINKDLRILQKIRFMDSLQRKMHFVCVVHISFMDLLFKSIIKKQDVLKLLHQLLVFRLLYGLSELLHIHIVSFHLIHKTFGHIDETGLSGHRFEKLQMILDVTHGFGHQHALSGV